MRIGKESVVLLLGVMGIGVMSWERSLQAEIRPEKVHVADSKKNKSYVHDGLIVGGDRAINDVVVKSIRRSANPKFERVVIDLEAERAPSSLQRPPYFQLAVTPDERRLVVTLWGKPKLSFDPKKVLAAFRKSSAIESVELLPRLEEESWTFVLNLRSDFSVEAFELSQPIRVIMDIQRKKG